MNEHDSERIAGLLETSGYQPASSAEEADLVLFNTCAVRENADNRLYGTLGHYKAIKEERPELVLAVGGCQMQKDREIVFERAPWVDVAFGTFAIDRIPELLVEHERTGGSVFDFRDAFALMPSDLPTKRQSTYSAWVSVSIGCDNACTFCIVPAVRGPQVSRRLGDIVDEVSNLAADGVVEVTLLGQNVNTYGRDLDGKSRFADLLTELDQIPQLRRLRFTSPHPRDFTQDVVDAMAASRTVCEHIHFPLQSGSDAVLASMRRSYRSERYLGLLNRLRTAIPNLAVSTDIIVGFPGETEEDFQATLDVVSEARFDSAYTFLYSKRPDTPAAEYESQIDPDVAQERFQRLIEMQERISMEKMHEEIGKVHELLIEGPSKKDPSRATGRTRTNKLVHLETATPAGAFVNARITSAHPHFLDAVEA